MFNQKPLGFGTVVPVYKLRIGVFQRAPSPVDCAVSFHAPPPLSFPLSPSPAASRGKTFHSVQQFRKPCLCFQIKVFIRFEPTE